MQVGKVFVSVVVIGACVASSPCDEYGKCDQKCEPTADSYRCVCDSQYILQEDGRTCKAANNTAVMIYSTGTTIRGYGLKSKYMFAVEEECVHVVAVDFDGKYVYSTDVVAELLVRSRKDGSDRKPVATVGLGTPDGVAVDWITGNIYFTDVEKKHIGVCNNDGKICTMLTNKDIDKPRAIVLDPSKGKMYWSDWGYNPMIAASNMDGKEDYVVVTEDLHWPNGLAIDYSNDRLYWADGRVQTLESIRMDGTGRQLILRGVIKHPFAISLFENRIYVSDWQTKSIVAVDKFTGDNLTTVISGYKIYGVNIYYPALKPAMVNPCQNSKCSDLCIISGPQKYACECPIHKTLSSDQHTCTEISTRPRLGIAARNMLIDMTYPLIGLPSVNELFTDVEEIGAMAYNPLTHSVFVSDVGDDKEIVSVNLQSEVTEAVLTEGLEDINTMSFDYLGNNLYWFNNNSKTIEMLSLSTMNRKVVNTNYEDATVMALVLVPEEGYLFAAVKTEKIQIVRMNMDGTMQKTVVSSGLSGSIAMHYDRQMQRIVIADSATGKIISINTQGGSRRNIKELDSSPMAVCSFKDEVFWINKKTSIIDLFIGHRIYWSRTGVTGINNNKLIKMGILPTLNVNQIIAINQFEVPSHKCSVDNGDCSHICIPKKELFACACPHGMQLAAEDRFTCVGDEFYNASQNIEDVRSLEDNNLQSSYLWLIITLVIVVVGVLVAFYFFWYRNVKYNSRSRITHNRPFVQRGEVNRFEPINTGESGCQFENRHYEYNTANMDYNLSRIEAQSTSTLNLNI